MTDPRTLLAEAGASLVRAQVLLERAAGELGPPFAEPVQLLADDVERLRLRARNATLTATGP